MKRACLRASVRRAGQTRTVATAAAYKQAPQHSGNGDSEQSASRSDSSKWARTSTTAKSGHFLGDVGGNSATRKWERPPPAHFGVSSSSSQHTPRPSSNRTVPPRATAGHSAGKWVPSSSASTPTIGKWTPPYSPQAIPQSDSRPMADLWSPTPAAQGTAPKMSGRWNANADPTGRTAPAGGMSQRSSSSKWTRTEQTTRPEATPRYQADTPQNVVTFRDSSSSRVRLSTRPATGFPEQSSATHSRHDRGPAPHQVSASTVHSHVDRSIRTPRPGAPQDKASDSRIKAAPSASEELLEGNRTRLSRKEFKTRGSLREKTWANDEVATTQPAPAVKKVAKIRELKAAPVDVFIPSMCSVGHLSRVLNVRLERLQRKMAEAGMAEESSYDYVLTEDYAALLAAEFNRNPIINDEAAFDLYPPPLASDTSRLPARPPVVTIMGHVDHGKTTLLDTLRSTSVAKGEAGGITQHIGAFSVPVPSLSVSGAATSGGPKSITFLDTPGHAAFSAMRARGARVTDVVVLVVAADDGVMPQTREVIELIKKDEGKVGVVVAINKVDKPEADVEKVQKALLVEGIQLEAFGGDIPSVEVSGLTGKGLDQLVETISALSELQDLRAERDGVVHGHVLESRVERGLGSVATVLVHRGCLKPGTHVVCGKTHAKVRVMKDSAGKPVKAAYPGDAITVSGWKEVPSAGDEVISGSESDVKKALANRMRKAEQEAALVDLEAINASRRAEREKREAEEAAARAAAAAGQGVSRPEREDTSGTGPKELRIIIKGDVSGSVEAVAGALQGIGNNQAVVKIVSTGVGDVAESDIQMAQSSGGVIVAFCVNVPRSVDMQASQNGIPICSSAIIYQLMDDIKERVIALLPVTLETRVTGEATVLQLFDIQLKAKQTMKVAGCRVMNGIIEKTKSARVIRDGVMIFEGPIETMRHMKKDVTELRKGSECGLSIQGFNDFREGDQIQAFSTIEKPGQL